jgi:hypothetical protein
MPQKIIKFKGINRNINEFQTSGECEELINLRPVVGGGHRVVKPKEIFKEDSGYDMFFEHSWGSYNNIIQVSNGVVIWTNKKYNPYTITDEFYDEEVILSAAGNTLVVYCDSRKEQRVFKFKDYAYKSYDVSPNLIKDIRVEYGDVTSISATYETDTLGQIQDAANRAASSFYANFINGLCGVSVIGCTYELEDGNEIWSTGFIVADSRKGNAGTLGVDTISNKVTVSGTKETSLVIDFNIIDSSNVKKINVYSSKPSLPYEVTESTDSDGNVSYNPLRKRSDAGIMYYQGSVEPNNSSATLKLKFGTVLSAEKIMDVNSGVISRVGYNIPYNNRFHYYKSNVYFHVQTPTCSLVPEDTYAKFISYVQINNKWILTNKIISYDLSGRAPSGGTTIYIDTISDFIYPMAGIKKLAFVLAESDGDEITEVPYSSMFFVDLEDSSSYNYSYAYDVMPDIIEVPESFYNELSSSGQLWEQVQSDGYTDKILLKEETNAINVSAQYNPLVFPVEYSYNYSGEIIDVATAYLPVSSVQAGQFPITVFTANGIFAMEQGNGAVLYSNIVPLQPLVIDGKAEPTPYGTFFVSLGNLYLLQGRESINLSTVLDGKRDLRIREADAYKRLYCEDGSVLFKFEPLLSKVDFKDYVSNAGLFYDQLNNELYISSRDTDKPYSYVFNLDSKSFYKSSKKYVHSGNLISKYAVELIGDKVNIVYIDFELDIDDQPIFLQSRPLALEQLYTHIQRLILLADAELSGTQNLCLSVFASDNLHDWKCVISSQKHDVILRQIRTNKAAKSYKDYVIVISGVVSTSTDISDIIADYTVVNRRLG